MSESFMSSETVSSTPAAEDTMKVLVATDIHLGYGEKDPIIHEDSFIAFEEILGHALKEGADYVILGGDLFHDAKPTPNSYNKCIKLLRNHVLGDKPIEVEYLSDQTINFAESLTQTVNYEDPNMNIQLPIYSIHGNHDDVSGFGRLSAMDIMASSGLINYFGKWTDLTKIHINPIVLRKGKTRLALYGLSHIHDARLARLFHDSKVTFQKPAGDNEEWFNIMVLHQNRADRGLKNFLPEESLPKFLDLAIWGHEHDCRINPEQNPKNGVYITQPGSSVATSLSEGEAEDKHCGLLLISQKNFKMIPIKLETVRPFIFETIDLEDYQDELDEAEGDLHEKVYQFCVRKIQQMIEKSKEKLSGNPKQPKIPLIRLRVIYNDEEQLCNPVRLGQQFAKEVANSTDVVKFIKQASKKSKGAQVRVDESVLKSAYQQAQQTRAEDVVDQYFADLEADDQKLELFHSKTLSEMCRRLVDNDDDDAADIILKQEMKMAINFLQEKNATDENIKDFITDFRDFKGDEVHNSILGMLDANPTKRTQVASSNGNGGLGGSSSDDDVAVVRPAGRGAARGGRGAATRGANTSTRGTRGRGRGAKAAAPPPDPPSTGLNVKVNRSTSSRAASKQPAITQFTSQVQSQRTSARNASKRSMYVSDSESD